KRALGWPEDSDFLIPDEAREAFADARQRGEEAHAAWNRRREEWAGAHAELAIELDRRFRRELPEGWDEKIGELKFDDKIATRAASGKVINAIAPALPELLGGSADLTESNQT